MKYILAIIPLLILLTAAPASAYTLEANWENLYKLIPGNSSDYEALTSQLEFDRFGFLKYDVGDKEQGDDIYLHLKIKKMWKNQDYSLHIFNSEGHLIETTELISSMNLVTTFKITLDYPADDYTILAQYQTFYVETDLKVLLI